MTGDGLVSIISKNISEMGLCNSFLQDLGDFFRCSEKLPFVLSQVVLSS